MIEYKCLDCGSVRRVDKKLAMKICRWCNIEMQEIKKEGESGRTNN